MNIFRTAVARPIATAMTFLAIIVFGVYSFVGLPVDLFPDIDVPNLTVITTYPGAGALEVEENITDPLESLLGTVPNLEEMRSTSQDDLSIINLEFGWDISMEEAANDVRDRISQARRLLPDDVDDPIIWKFDASAIPVIIYSATATESYAELEEIIDDYLAGPLNRIGGVGDVSITGAPILEIHVDVDPRRLEALNLDVQQITQALNAENISSPAGRIDLEDTSYNLRINSEFTSLDDLRQIIVASVNGHPVHLHEVASVREGFADESAISRVNKRQGVTFAVQRQSDANTVAVARAVRAAMPGLVESLPDDVEIDLIIDTSEFIVTSIDNLSNVLFYALIFVVLVVLVFLRQWRATVIVAATIPVSLIVAFIYLALTGSTLNIISLSSLSIALGMVVDDAIVVLENIIRHIEEGSRPRDAAVYGTREVGTAVFATTLTVVAVFFPLTFLGGPTGIWFGQLGMIVVVTVVTSTLAALTLTPMLASVLLKRAQDRPPPGMIAHGISSAFEKILGWMEAIYGATLRWALHNKIAVVVMAIAVFASSILMIPAIGTEYMPVSDDGQIQVSGELETHRSLQHTSQVVRHLEDRITAEVPELELLNTTSGQGGGMMGVSGAGNEFQLRLALVSVTERERSVFEIADQVRAILDAVPDVVTYTASTGSGGGNDGSPIQVEILGYDLDATTALGQELADQMESIEGLRDISLSRGKSRPEFEIVFDRESLSNFHLTAAQVASAVRGNLAGQTATRFRRDGQEFDVVVRYPQGDRASLSQVESMRIMSPLGVTVSIQDIGEIREFQAPPNVERIDRDRVLTVSAGLQDRPLNRAVEEIQEWIDDLELPPQIVVRLAGDFEEQQEAFFDLFLVLILSIVLVYLVMAAQLESLKEPFVIMFAIPFAFTGVLLALLLTNTPLSVIGFVGAIILVGIVVKNAIVLVDYIKLLRGRGIVAGEAIIAGGIARLRPVVMTTLTTVLAMLPLAINLGEGAETWQPMAISVIGGLLFSTLVTLVLVPVLYAAFDWRHLFDEENSP